MDALLASVYPMSSGCQKCNWSNLISGILDGSNCTTKSHIQSSRVVCEKKDACWPGSVGRSLYCKQRAQKEGGASDDGELFVKKIFPASHNRCPPLVMFRREGDD